MRSEFMVAMLGTRSILGLAVEETGIIVAELEVRSGRPLIRRVGEFLWEQEFRPENIQTLGGQFRQFLRDQHFSAKQAAIGLAAKWVLAKEITVPAASTDVLAGMLSIQAERAFSLNAGELAFDYCRRGGAAEKGQVLLLAAQRQLVRQVEELARVAGLRVQSVTVSALALGAALSEADPEHGYGLYVRPTYCEFWSRCDGGPQFVNHVPLPAQDGAPDDYIQSLAPALRRAILLAPQRDGARPRRITTYDARGLPEDIAAALHEQLAPEMAVVDGRAELLSQGLGSADGAPEMRSVAGAAVALTAVKAGGPAVDFLNPKLGRRKAPAHKRVKVWAAIITVALLVAAGTLLADWRRNSLDVRTYTEQLAQMSDDIAAAQEIVERVSHARSWTSRRPQFLECLRQLTEAFPQEPRIWARSLRLLEDSSGVLVGKTDREESFYEVLDKLKQNKAFAEVKMVYLRDAGRGSREKEFAINFKFGGVK
jgi:hypothetical protein